MSKLRRLRQLAEENSRLKRLVADLSLDKHMLSEALRKKSKARTPSRTGRLVSRHLSGQLPAGLPLVAVWAGVVVSTKPREGSIRLADTYSRSRPGPSAIWVSTHLGAPASRRLAGESQAGTTALSIGGLAAADARAAAEAHRPPPRPGSDTSGPHVAVEYGFCA